MNKEKCEDYKKSEIWRPDLCRFCVARDCQDRKDARHLVEIKVSKVFLKRHKVKYAKQRVWNWSGVKFDEVAAE